MKIEITDRLMSFSHTPGHLFMVPGSFWKVAAFPTALVFYGPAGEKIEYHLNLEGPIDPFTVEQDLETKTVRIYGQSSKGYFRSKVFLRGKSLFLLWEKMPESGVLVQGQTVHRGEEIEVCKVVTTSEKLVEERLFLGASKKKDCDQMRRRKDLREILPLWYGLGSITPREGEGPLESELAFLKEAIQRKDKPKIESLFSQTYLAHFSSGLVPRKEDEERQGLFAVQPSDFLLQEGASCIRSLFLQERGDEIHVLPCVPSLFVCGKLVHACMAGGGSIDLEWTKGRLRRMHVLVEKDQNIKLRFSSEIDGFRLKRSLKDRGREIEGNLLEISVKSGDALWLDRFQK